MSNNDVYLKKLLNCKDNFSVKVITGIRGVGKTTLLSTFAETLKQQGIPSESIIYINFEEMEEIYNFQQLYEFVNDRIIYLEQAYLLFDEIQRVKGWEKAINAFFVGAPVDIYITSSNSEILSENFLHLLSDHYELINMQPLSFSEYIEIISKEEKISLSEEISFQQYLKYGGLPIVAKLQKQNEVLPILLSGIYNTILNKDIIAAYCVRDVILLNAMNKFLALNIGKSIKPKMFEDYLLNLGQTTTVYTMDNYLSMIDKAGIFHRVIRYDVKKQSILNGSEKFYSADIGIRNALINFNDFNNEAINEGILENLVYIELCKRGYKIFIGKNGKSSISFIAFKNEKPVYFQVISKIDSKVKLRKILFPLQNIKDQYDKVILTMDKPEITDYNGIKVFHILDFLHGVADS